MIKWDKVEENYKYKRPDFWSVCSFFHRFSFWCAEDLPWWYKHQMTYSPLCVKMFCSKCKQWWYY